MPSLVGLSCNVPWHLNREKAKLNLSHRTKPPDSEPFIADNLCLEGSDPSHVETANEAHHHANIVNPDLAGTESTKEERQRPKLNRKHLTRSLEILEGNTRSDRNALFGGARPRELVLKERRVDDAAINDYCAAEETNRVEYDRARKLSDHSMQSYHFGKAKDAHQWAARKPERRDQWVNTERTQRRNWNRRGDEWRNTRASDRQQISDRRPSPEMWRKPTEQQKSSNAVDLLQGKATSAVELAQAFSRSMSDPK